MTGIISYGSYVPRYRLSREVISSAMGWLGQAGSLPGEKAIANYDEDSITMAVAASNNCLIDRNRDHVDGLYFASTSAPYKEREGATIISNALDLSSAIHTVDFSNSLKCGTSALLGACDSVKAGSANKIIVCSSDCRIGKPGGSAEMVFGDAGASFLIGKENVIASLEGSFAVSYDFPDHWRAQYDRYDRALEDRLIRDEGYSKFISQTISGLMKKYSLDSKNIAKVLYPCLYKREFATIGKSLGFEPTQLQESLLNTIGDAGTASPLLMLISALETAKPDDNIIVASYGNGSVALWFKVTKEIEKTKKGILNNYVSSKKNLDNYEKYLAFRNIIPAEAGMRGEIGATFMPTMWRERKFIMGLVGSKCKKCGTPQLPPQRICVNPDCGAVDNDEPYRFSDKKGKLFSYTEDRLAFTINPPQIYGMVDFDGGGRYIFDLTDCDSGALKVGDPVEITFRRKYADENRGVTGYFWKAMPVR